MQVQKNITRNRKRLSNAENTYTKKAEVYVTFINENI
jgi:hypothetical protein